MDIEHRLILLMQEAYWEVFEEVQSPNHIRLCLEWSSWAEFVVGRLPKRSPQQESEQQTFRQS